MKIVIDTKDQRIIVPRSFFPEIDRMNRILKDNKIDKTVVPEEYITEQFAVAIKKTILRTEDKVRSV